MPKRHTKPLKTSHKTLKNIAQNLSLQ